MYDILRKNLFCWETTENARQQQYKPRSGRWQTSQHLLKKPLLHLLQFHLYIVTVISIDTLTVIRLPTTLFLLGCWLADHRCRFSRYAWRLGNRHRTFTVPLSQVKFASKLQSEHTQTFKMNTHNSISHVHIPHSASQDFYCCGFMCVSSYLLN